MEYVDKLLKETDFISVIKEIEQLEEKREFCRHGMEHLLSVARIAHIINLEQNLGEEKEVLYLEALLHDIGRLEEYRFGIPHEKAGEKKAGELLRQIGYPAEKRERILEDIRDHRKESDSLLWRADKQSRNCFSCSAYGECYWKNEQRTKKIEC